MQYISSDSNIWFDFKSLRHLDWPFALDCVFCMSSDAIREELVSPPELKQQLFDLGLQSVDIDDNEFTMAFEYTQKYTQLSIYDGMALAIAKVRGFILLTGDGPLRKAAVEEAVEVHGTLWVFDQLLDNKKILLKEYIAVLTELRNNPQGRRLPQAEITKRLSRKS